MNKFTVFKNHVFAIQEMFWISINFIFKTATFFPADAQRPAAWRGGGFQHIFNASQRRQKYTNSCPARYADIAPNCSVVGICLPTAVIVKILRNSTVPFLLHDTFFNIPTNRTVPSVVSRYIFQKTVRFLA